MVQAHRSKRPPSGLGVRRFRIMVANCRRCGWEWPGHVEQCARCAAVVGEPRAVHCERLVAPATAQSIEPGFVVVAAIEMSRRGGSAVDDWASRAWATLAPRLAGAIRVAPGRTGTILAAWALEGPESVDDVAEIALAVGERGRGSDGVGLELRGAIACGVIDDRAGTAAVECWAERLALAARAGQWLVSLDVASALSRRFVLRAGGLVCRWPCHPTEAHRSLVSRLQAPVLPSAVSGGPPRSLMGRERERRQLLSELTVVAGERGRRVLLVSAPAGGGKSYLVRRVLADSGVRLAGGVAFPPLGSRSLDPVRALLAAVQERPGSVCEDRLGLAIAEAAARRAEAGPCAIVIDDVHWASPRAVAEVTMAIAQTAEITMLAWVLLTRTSALERVRALIELADLTLELPPLVPSDRERLLVGRLGSVPAGVRRHVGGGPARGNPLYLVHLAELIKERPGSSRLPDTLHEAVLMRLDQLADRVRQLTAWPNRSFNVQDDLQQLEHDVGDWLDRLETSDIADLMTIGRYLARLRGIDADLVIARSILGMPVASNRRLAQTVERLAAASTDALLDFLQTEVAGGRASWAVHAAEAAAAGAERALRLVDAERLLGFASVHDPDPALRAVVEISRWRSDGPAKPSPHIKRRPAEASLTRGWDGQLLQRRRCAGMSRARLRCC